MNEYQQAKIHLTADVSPQATIGAGTLVWHHAQIREGASLGSNCVISKGVYIDTGVQIGNNVKIQNNVSIYHGVTIEDGVFCGPHCVFTNDKTPRAVNPDGSLKSGDDWILTKTLVCRGASIGAGATIVCGVTIGRWAMIGSGSVVSRDVPDNGLVWGNPARLRGFVCACGTRLAKHVEDKTLVMLVCPACGRQIQVNKSTWETIHDSNC